MATSDDVGVSAAATLPTVTPQSEGQGSVAQAEETDAGTQTQTQTQTGNGDEFSAFPNELEFGTDSSDTNTERDNDSALGTSVVIYEYMEENGRTYHAYNSGKYMLPNDEREQDRLDLQHHSFRVMLNGKLYLAPIQSPNRVLDLATGTGIWAIEFAQENTESTVVGTDLSPIQPLYVPPNCQFEVDDAENDWNFSEPFDYIHARAVVTCFKDNRAMVKKIFDNLKPGGYFEFQDPCLPMLSDDKSLEGTALDEWNNHLVESMSRMGRNLKDSQNWGQYMKDAGFVDVTETRFYVPVNPWARGKKAKLLGAISYQNLNEGIASLSTAAFTRILGWDQPRLEVFLASVRADLANKDIHAYGVVYFVHGRKPETAEA
ncbi:related to methyltransferase [Rhynchosporium secalis]|uniref:Related to methyltransferase n=1 Tax=Rhynchosporium secalis TaxID=38038 RepID=A0A1E1MIA2_RHYSE|nr:related to methyltransferase [Rhynchosporium secalis]